ncbi:phosphatidylinositol mannoside acyltransferase [Corynebacterium liangguodongii]|uniref:Phosphatidylinositol mannoside acyltransferase n=1 Tax=Corynebacterium liangguodongii TaxID=2079535 RepID=A0A2S0WEB7_9CORY|nr:phosphatidylinositol mannoside acyltransferase [Corynebacterium liangguodongii]AWB84127.1 phosphatidylinositol mannoside acyltransferase [Corynebacterium liangguodongii]PWC00138.1 phosphatidylinositol mannoside acyltransferase [Corynebacterium liangguodongii]
MKQELIAGGYVAGWRLVGALPESWAAALFRTGADIASDRGRGAEMLRRNLIRVVGAGSVDQRLVRASMRSYARYWKEAFQLPRLAGQEDVLARIDAGVSGREHFEAAYSRGRGVILALPHSGNWDMAGMWFVANYGGFTTVAERVEPAALFQAFVDFRNSLGFEVLPLTGGERPPYARLKEVLAGGGIVCLLGERDLTARGVAVDFFGEPTTMPAGPAKLAIDTGAALIAVHSAFGGPGEPPWLLTADPEIEVTTLERTTQLLADRFAANIAAHPADWHMLQPMWPADRPKRRRR